MSEPLRDGQREIAHLREALDLAIELGEKLQAKADRYERGAYVVTLSGDETPGLFGPFEPAEAQRLASEHFTDHGGACYALLALPEIP